jgi:hypothetical protein
MFQHKAKISSFKNTNIKIDLLLLLLLLLLLPRGQNSLSYYILYNESKNNNPCLGRQGQKRGGGVKVHHFHKVLSMPLLYLGASNSSRKPFNNTIWVAPKT